MRPSAAAATPEKPGDVDVGAHPSIASPLAPRGVTINVLAKPQRQSIAVSASATPLSATTMPMVPFTLSSGLVPVSLLLAEAARAYHLSAARCRATLSSTASICHPDRAMDNSDELTVLENKYRDIGFPFAPGFDFAAVPAASLRLPALATLALRLRILPARVSLISPILCETDQERSVGPASTRCSKSPSLTMPTGLAFVVQHRNRADLLFEKQLCNLLHGGGGGPRS